MSSHKRQLTPLGEDRPTGCGHQSGHESGSSAASVVTQRGLSFGSYSGLSRGAFVDSFEKNPGRWPVRGNALQARFLVESAWEKAEVGAESIPEFCGKRKMERTYMVGYKWYGQRCWTKCCDSRWLLAASIAWPEVGSYCPRNHVWS